MIDRPLLGVEIDGNALREAIDFAKCAGPQAEAALATGFMRLLDTTTAIAANTLRSNPALSGRTGLIQIRADRWGKELNRSFNWGIHALEQLPAVNWSRPNVMIYHGGLVHFGPSDPGDGRAPSLTVSLGRQAGAHEWSIHT